MNRLDDFFERNARRLEQSRYKRWMPIYQGFRTFLFTPRRVAGKTDVQIFDAVDLKRVMIMVVLALVPCMLFGMYNVGYQHFEQIKHIYGTDYTFWEAFLFGAQKVVPMLIVSYGTGLGIEFFVSYLKGRDIEEGFLVSGMLIAIIMPVTMPLWMIGLSTAFAVIIGKEIFGGTGMNVWNPALLARAFAFFSYPTYMTGSKVWVDGAGTVDGMSGETIIGQLVENAPVAMPVQGGAEYSLSDIFFGLIPGSVGETSTFLIILGALFLIYTGVASWKIIAAGIAGGAFTGIIFNLAGPEGNALMQFPWWEHLMIGSFSFALVFMATDPVSAAQTETGKWIYGFLVGSFGILLRIANPAYPEGMMLAILFCNTLAPTIDYCVVGRNIARRKARAHLAGQRVNA